MKEIAKAYNHEEFEDRIYQNWEESGYFKPEFGKELSYDRQKDGEPFVIMMPPPNVTGKLHIGHSLVLTLEDIMTRYHRLLGEIFTSITKRFKSINSRNCFKKHSGKKVSTKVIQSTMFSPLPKK